MLFLVGLFKIYFVDFISSNVSNFLTKGGCDVPLNRHQEEMS